MPTTTDSKCMKCREMKPPEDYSRSKSGRVSRWCDECRDAASRERKAIAARSREEWEREAAAWQEVASLIEPCPYWCQNSGDGYRHTRPCGTGAQTTHEARISRELKIQLTQKVDRNGNRSSHFTAMGLISQEEQHDASGGCAEYWGAYCGSLDALEQRLLAALAAIPAARAILNH